MTIASISLGESDTDAALLDRVRELSQLVDMAPSHVWRLTPDGEPTFFNKRMADYLGLDVADTGKPGMSRLEAVIETVIHPDDKAQFREIIYRSLETGATFALRYRLRRADGVYRWMSSRAEPTRDRAGRIVQWYGICHDIDDQMRAEEVVRRSERQLRQMIDAVPVRIWSTTAAGGPVYFNKRYQDFLRSFVADFDRLEDQRMEQIIQELVHPEDAPVVQRTLQNCFAAGVGAVMKFRWRENSGHRWTECRVAPWHDQDGTVVQWYGVSIDIDDQMQAEEALRRSEQQLRQLVDTVPVQIWTVAGNGEPGYMNKTMLDYMGMRLDDYDVRKGLPDVLRTLYPDDQPLFIAGMSHSFMTGEPFELKYRNRRWDGQYRWTQGRAVPLRDDGGRIIFWYGVNLDIHDTLTSQEALLERERELSLLVDMVPVNIGRMTPDGEPTFFSKRTLASIGMDDVAARDRPDMSRLTALIASNIHPEDGPRMTEVMSQALATGEPYEIKYRRRRADGAYRWMSGLAEPLRDQSGAIVQWYTATIDIDDEVRAQEALWEREREREQARARLEQLQADFAHTARVSMLGELTASIAHEVNQPLAAIMASSQASLNWLARPTPDVDKIRKLTEDVVADAQRASEIIGRVRAMATGRPPEQTLLSLDDLIHEALLFLRHEVEWQSVTVSHVPASGPLQVLGDRTQLQQVIVNLAINAVQAMAQAGSARRAIIIRTVSHDRVGLQCSVEDSGPGIEPHQSARLFDSFFTTKKNGMGMGLRICRSVIEAHGGRIAADNESANGGARFYFTLPVASA